MILGGYRYGLFPYGDHTMGGGGAENPERGRIRPDQTTARRNSSRLLLRIYQVQECMCAHQEGNFNEL